MFEIENYSFLFENIKLGIVYQNRQGQIIKFNKAANQILGLNPEQLTALNSVDPIWRAIHPDGSNYPGDEHPAMLALKTGQEIKDNVMGIYNYEKNDYKWININAIPQFRQGESEPYQVMSVFEDITEKKLAEYALENIIARNEAILKANPDLMFVFRSDGVILDYHSNQINSLYLPPEHFLGKKVDDVLPLEIALLTHEKINQVLTSHQPVYATYKLGNSSKTGHYEARYVLHNKNEVLAIVRDITEQKKAEEALLHREHVLKAVAIANQTLLSDNSLEETVNQALEIIGNANNQDRVYVFDFHNDPINGELLMSQRYEWVKNGISLQIDNPELQNMPVIDLFPRWHDALKKGQLITGNVVDFPESERKILEPQDIISILVVPVIFGENCWGFVGFDNCHSESDWSSSEVSILSTTASSIGMAIVKQQRKDELLAAKRLLEEREERFRLIINNSSDVLGIINKNGTFSYLSQALEKITGYLPHEIIGSAYSELIHSDNIEKVNITLNNAFQNPGKVFTVEFKAFNKEKRWIDLETVGLNLIHEPAINGILISIRDITERKKAEIALRESEQNYKRLQQLFRNLADNMPDMLWAKDLDNKYIFVNKAICEKLLIANDTNEPIGKTDLFFARRQRLLFPENPNWHTFGEICADTDTVVVNSQQSSQFDEYGNVRNKFLFLDVIKTPLRNEKGEMIGVVGSGRDVTERKRDEKILKIQYNIAMAMVTAPDFEHLLEKVIEELSLLIDTSNFFVAFYNHETDRFKNVIWRDQFDIYTEWVAANSLSGQVVKQSKTLLLSKPQIEKFAKENNLILKGSPAECWLGVPLEINNRIFGVLVIQSYNNENAYDQTSANLLEIIAHELSIFIEKQRIFEDLVAAKEKAEESERLKTAFLQNISHEIRTPLNAISGFSQMLNMQEIEDEKRLMYSSIIIKSSNQLLSIVNDILTISFIETKQEKASIGKVSINEIMYEIHDVFKFHFSNNKVEFNFNPGLRNEESVIFTDKTKLIQILSNLISNAIKFTKEGYVNFGYNIRNIEAKSHLKDKTAELKFYVSDSGIGIKQGQQIKIFDRFHQADRSIQSNYGGTGLGLTISKGLVELLGGKIWVESIEGKGSSFFFTIPYQFAGD